MSLRQRGMPSSFFRCLILLPEYTEPIVPFAVRRVCTTVIVCDGLSSVDRGCESLGVWASPSVESFPRVEWTEPFLGLVGVGERPDEGDSFLLGSVTSKTWPNFCLGSGSSACLGDGAVFRSPRVSIPSLEGIVMFAKTLVSRNIKYFRIGKLS